jgi:hypothetical protein
MGTADPVCRGFEEGSEGEEEWPESEKSQESALPRNAGRQESLGHLAGLVNFLNVRARLRWAAGLFES